MNYYSGEFYLIVFHLVIGVIGIVWIGIDLLILSYKEKQKRKIETWKWKTKIYFIRNLNEKRSYN